jgi:hypothetical protein
VTVTVRPGATKNDQADRAALSPVRAGGQRERRVLDENGLRAGGDVAGGVGCQDRRRPTGKTLPAGTPLRAMVTGPELSVAVAVPSCASLTTTDDWLRRPSR